MNLKPLANRVVVKPMKQEEVTKSGIVLPDTASKERPQEGKVVAVGPGKLLESGKREPLEVKENDKIIFSKYAGTEIKIQEEDYLILTDSDILAIIDKK
ncbi:MAG: co-chaperone GroES [Candidatus Wallbacteria bacterium]|nr:co-chaperone GroES [Candidatus Wallbacteria bacterium]